LLALPPYVTTSLAVDGDAAAYADGSVNIITNNFTLYIITRHWHLYSILLLTPQWVQECVSVTEVGVAGWAWSLRGKKTWIGKC